MLQDYWTHEKNKEKIFTNEAKILVKKTEGKTLSSKLLKLVQSTNICSIENHRTFKQILAFEQRKLCF